MRTYGNIQDTLENLVHPEKMFGLRKEIKFAYDQLNKDLAVFMATEGHEGISVGQLSEIIGKIVTDMGLTGEKKNILDNFFDIYVGSVKSVGVMGGHEFAMMVINGEEIKKDRKRNVHAEVMNSPKKALKSVHERLGFFPELVATTNALMMTHIEEVEGLEIETDDKTHAKVKLMMNDSPNITLLGDAEDRQILMIVKNKKTLLFCGEML